MLIMLLRRAVFVCFDSVLESRVARLRAFKVSDFISICCCCKNVWQLLCSKHVPCAD